MQVQGTDESAEMMQAAEDLKFEYAAKLRDEIKDLDKEVKKLKRIASEWASQLHDLVEDRLPAGFHEIPGIAQSTYDACKAWADAHTKLATIQKEKG